MTLDPLWISLRAAGLATVLVGVLGTGAAYALAGRRGRLRTVLDSVFLAPLVLPPTVVGFLLLLLLSRNGLLGGWLQAAGLRVVFTWGATVIASAVVAFPLMYRTALGAFEQVDGQLLQVARSLGASPWGVLTRVALPLAGPGLLAGLTLAFARALGEFGATLMLAGNIPGQTQTLPVAIYFAVEAGDWAAAWGWSGLILGLCLGAVALGQVRWGRPAVTGHRGGLSSSPSPSLVPPEPAIGLALAIHKQLGGFRLDVALATQQQTLGILGASGAGKSLLLRCLAGLETPEQGWIRVQGQTWLDRRAQVNRPPAQRRVGWVVQQYALFPHLTVWDNIGFGLHGRPAETCRQRIAEHITRLGLGGLEHRYPHQLSGGQQQRVALARALVTEPDLLLLDEPFAALDSHLRHRLEMQLQDLLATFPGQVVLVSHNLEELYRLCTDLLVLVEGRGVAYGPRAEIFGRPHRLDVALLTGCKNVSRAQWQADGSVLALDWACLLKGLDIPSDLLTHIGIRAHHLRFPESGQGVNTFPCTVAAHRESPHRVSLFLTLYGRPAGPQGYHLQAEVWRETWQLLRERPTPWWVQLAPAQLLGLVEAPSSQP
ncbi:MAG: molybdate ABC transporter permease subunit [Gloeomargaritaceae cyanobacterium C42_A2020_066]|nr:molybdate ABC transporter permease subunit [Gloeomargaritaceae cyanobacterium C42_A2020_066]